MPPEPRLAARRQPEIFVGVDSSECSRSALHWAAGLARRLGYRLHVVEAWEYPRDTVVRVGRVELPTPEHAEELLRDHLDALVAEVDEEHLALTVDVLRGPPSEAILHAADARARMIVVGSRGLGGFRGLLLGSVSRQLCEHAPCPVTVVRNCAPEEQPRLETIAVGVDGSVNAQRAVRFAAELAEGTGASVVAVHAAAPGAVPTGQADDAAVAHPTLSELLEGWCAPLEQRGLDEHDLVIAEGDPRTALLDVAQERGADLIVVGSRGLGPVSKLVLGSVANSLIQYSPVPVTVVPPEPRH